MKYPSTLFNALFHRCGGIVGMISGLALPIAGVLVISGCTRPEATGSKNEKKGAPSSIRLIAAEAGTLARTVQVTGTLAADQEVIASFKVPGRIRELLVDLGSPVRERQVLARLEPSDFTLRVAQAEAALRQIRARLGLAPEGSDDAVVIEKTAPVLEAAAVLNEAKLNRDRMARLLEKDYISKVDYDAAVARLLVAEGRYQASVEEIRDRQALLAQRKSELAIARQQLEDAVLAAPIDGAVKERKASVGEFVAAGAPVLTLVKVHPLRLKVPVPERDAAVIRPGQAVKVKVSGESSLHTGRVVRVSPSFDKLNRTLMVEAEIDNAQGRIKAGSFAEAEIVVDARDSVILIPGRSVIVFAGIEKVLTEKQGKAVERRIRTGRRSGEMVEVVEGLTAGDRIAADPGNVTGGDPVSVKP